MKRMKALVCCAAAACLAMVLAGCSSQQSYTPPEKSATVSSPTIGKSGTLRVGVNAGSPPLAGSPSSSSKIVGIDVDVAAALADHQKQPPARVVILLVELEMLVQVIDARGEQRDLDFGRTGVALVTAIFGHDFLFGLHKYPSIRHIAANQASRRSVGRPSKRLSGKPPQMICYHNPCAL